MRRNLTTGLVVLCILLSFVSMAVAENGHFRFAILSDRTGGHAPGVYHRVIEAINAEKPDFVITVGDHIEGYGEDYDLIQAEWDSLLPMLREIDAPVYMTPGNHDIWNDESEAIYIDRTGRKPFYSFDYDDAHFIILDNSRMESWNEMGLSQVSWLARDLTFTNTNHVFVFFHKPFWENTLHRGKEDNLHAMLADNGVEAVFSGHYHCYFTAEYDGVDYTAIGSSGGILEEATQPELRGLFYQFALVEVTPDGYELTIHDVDTGETYPQDFLTLDLRDEIENIEGELVGVTPIMVDGGDVPVEFGVTIDNETGRTIDGEAVWDLPDAWTVEPETESYSVPPGATQELDYVATRSGGIYPAPAVTLEYALSDGRTLEVRKDARIVRTVSAPSIGSVPATDGNVDGAMEIQAAEVTDLYQAYGYGPVDGDTEFLFAHDGDNLYVTAVCKDAHMDELATAATERDGPVYMDDCVGFFLQPDPDDMVVYQIYVNSAGVIFDQMITFDESMWYTTHPDWDGAFSAAASRKDDRWVAELKIPYAALRGPEQEAAAKPRFLGLGGFGKERVWGLNFRRKQHGAGAVDWQVPIDYNPETFGRLVFE